MYRPAAFDMTDLADVHAFINSAGPANLVTLNATGADSRSMNASVVPMLLDPAVGEHGSLLGHLARPNHQWRDLVHGVAAMAIFMGRDAYISPSYYMTKVETGKVVPTWNYEVVHVYGELVVHDDAAWVIDLVTRLTDHHEQVRAAPWSVDDTPAGYIETMAKGIVGIELRIVRVEGKRKLSQNRSVADIDSTIAGLSTGTADEQSVARSMSAARPE